MEVEHLATLERLRQSQRQDYLKVRKYIILYILYIFRLALALIPSLFNWCRVQFLVQCRQPIAS